MTNAFWIDAVITVVGLTIFYVWLLGPSRTRRKLKKEHPNWYK